MIINLEVYVVTDSNLVADRDLIDIVEKSLLGGAGFVQLREKDISTREYLHKAREIKKLVEKYKNRFFLVNDRVDIALASGADGVHLGQDDMPILDARRILGYDAIIGISVATVEEAKSAVADGADYLGVSAIYGTPTKAEVEVVGVDGLRQIAAAVDIPLVAIGGINRNNVSEVIKAGADGVAVVSEVMAAVDPAKAVRELLDQVNKVKQGDV